MKIITDQNFLKIPCEKANLEEVSNIILQLEKSLKDSETEGIGLAANQIGIKKRIAIIRFNKIEIDLVNADIVSSYDKILVDGEGCLSFPGRTEKTFRFNEIHVKNEVYPYNFIAVGLLSVAIQHELDHLNGILFIERALPK